MRRRALICAALLAAGICHPAAAAVTPYTDFSTFSAAAGPTALFDFNSTPDGSFDGTSYDVGPFTLTGDSTGQFADSEVVNGQVTGDACDLLCGASGFSYFVSFDTPISAFGATFSSVAGGLGSLVITIDGQGVAGSLTAEGFFGFVSDTAFTTIKFSSAASYHHFDDVRYAIATVAPSVPEPATWGMMIGGFALAGATMRRRSLRVHFTR
jgi:hypothetical protein